MKSTIETLRNSLDLAPDVDVKVQPEGIYIDDELYSVNYRGVLISGGSGDARVLINPIVRGLIMKLTVSLEVLKPAINHLIITTINSTYPPSGPGYVRDEFNSNELLFGYEDGDLVTYTNNGYYRISTDTHRVLLKKGNMWVVNRNTDHVVSKELINRLHGLLIQVGLI